MKVVIPIKPTPAAIMQAEIANINPAEMVSLESLRSHIGRYNTSVKMGSTKIRRARHIFDKFCQFEEMCTPGDDTGTIYGCLSAVLLAAALLQCQAPDLIGKITRLPRLFIAAVLLEMRPLWHTLQPLESTLGRSDENLRDILDAIRRVADGVWDEIYAGPRSVQYLNLIRDGILVGGGRQGWIDEGFDEEWEINADEPWASNIVSVP